MGRAAALHLWAIRLGAALLAIAVIAASAAPAVAKKKGKKKGGGGTVDITMPVGQVVPDRASADSVYGLLTSTIDIAGKRFQGKVIRDVNVTLQTSGTAAGSPARDLDAVLIAPNGASGLLFSNLFGTGPINASPVNIGPLTIDDEAGRYLDSGPARDLNGLNEPWAGSARSLTAPLYAMDNGPVSGTWTLRVTDHSDGETSILNFWRLTIAFGRPYRSK